MTSPTSQTSTVNPFSENNDNKPKKDNELERLIARRFIQRRDVFAVQRANGAYNPVNRKITSSDLTEHLTGRKTYGHYVVDHQGRCRIIALDIDWEDSVTFDGQEVNPREIFNTDHALKPRLIAAIRTVGDGLGWRLQRAWPKATVVTAFSGSKGIHIYGLIEKQILASDARSVATDCLTSLGFSPVRGRNFFSHPYHPGLSVEVFPKQEKVTKSGYGNLLRLPLGVHQKTRKRGFFYRMDSPLSELWPDDPMRALSEGSLA